VSGVDDLFERERPVVAAPDRLRTIRRLLFFATPLNLLGIACFTGVPGAILTLLAWQLADEELARVDSGALPADRRAPVRGLRQVAFAQLGFCVLSLATQIALFGMGFYSAILWGILAIFGVAKPVP
jgi:hypothetical protein